MARFINNMFGIGSNKTPSIEKDVQSFRDETGLSTRQLDWGLWFIRHRKKTVVAAVWLLGLLGAATIAYSLYSVGHYFIVGRAQDLELYKELNAPVGRPEGITELPLSYGSPAVYPASGNRYDIAVAVTNPNERGTAYFSYYFTLGDQKIGQTNSFILPGETKYLLALGQTLPGVGSMPGLMIENYSVKRIDSHQISDWEAYRRSHLDLQIENATYVPGSQSGLSEKISVGELDFTVTNRSPYGYQDARFIILLKSGDAVVGVGDYHMQNFRSGETRTPQLLWPGTLPSVTTIEIIPDIDILDPNIYMRYSHL